MARMLYKITHLLIAPQMSFIFFLVFFNCGWLSNSICRHICRYVFCLMRCGSSSHIYKQILLYFFFLFCNKINVQIHPTVMSMLTKHDILKHYGRLWPSNLYQHGQPIVPTSQRWWIGPPRNWSLLVLWLNWLSWAIKRFTTVAFFHCPRLF